MAGSFQPPVVQLVIRIEISAKRFGGTSTIDRVEGYMDTTLQLSELRKIAFGFIRP
jgi:hypothetical protein